MGRKHMQFISAIWLYQDIEVYAYTPRRSPKTPQPNIYHFAYLLILILDFITPQKHRDSCRPKLRMSLI